MVAHVGSKLNTICLENELRSIAKALVDDARVHDCHTWSYTDDDLAEGVVRRAMAAVEGHGR